MPNQFNLSPRAVLVTTAAQALTGSYVAGYLETNTNNCLGLLIKYTKGDETGLLVKVDVTSDKTLGILSDTGNLSSATNWFQRVSESTTAGVTTIVPNSYTMTATGNYAEFIYPIKGDGVRISLKADTIGSSPGTVTIWAITSWV